MNADNQKIEQALRTLYDEGIKSYKEEYRQEINFYDAVGMAISQHTDSGKSFVRIAYEALENWNHHSVCAVIDWMFPSLHPTTSKDSPAEEYMSTLERVKRMIDRQEVKVFTEWNTETLEYNVKTYKVEVVITEIK